MPGVRRPGDGGVLDGRPSVRTPSVPPATWAAVTTQVTWTLLCSGIRVVPDVLRDARDHTLLHLEPEVSPEHAADAALRCTERFVQIARRQVPEPLRDELTLNPAWRAQLLRAASDDDVFVLREHFGNGRTLDDLVHPDVIDATRLSIARGTLREVLRDTLAREGLPTNDWSDERLDAMLRRLAVFSPGPCPPMARVLAGTERDHCRDCVLCDRARRLVKTDRIGEGDLVLDRPVPWPRTPSDVLVLHFHPDARRHRSLLVSELEVSTAPLGDDLLLVDLDDEEHVHRVLLLAAEADVPGRAHIRGVVVRGPCRWSPRGLLGPLVSEGATSVRSAEWGVIDGLGELPAPLPPPPSARPVWVAALALAALTMLLLVQITGPASAANGRLNATFTPARQGVWAEFDLADTAYLTVLGQRGGRVRPLLQSATPGDKVVFAVGDGTYRAHFSGDDVLLVASNEPLTELQPLLAATSTGAGALSDLRQRIAARYPEAQTLQHRRTAP